MHGTGPSVLFRAAQAKLGRGKPSPWLVGTLARKPLKLVAVALANKMARVA